MNHNIKKSVFLTGANGLLGSHITRELLLRNYSVVAFIEQGKEPATLQGLNDIRFVYGNILNKKEVLIASQNCNYIIHAAASTAVMPARSQTINDINIWGTQNIINAAISNKAERLLYIGSANTFGYGTIDDPGNESRPFCGSKFGLDYIDSKYEAHQHVLNTINFPQLFFVQPLCLVNMTQSPVQERWLLPFMLKNFRVIPRADAIMYMPLMWLWP